MSKVKIKIKGETGSAWSATNRVVNVVDFRARLERSTKSALFCHGLFICSKCGVVHGLTRKPPQSVCVECGRESQRLRSERHYAKDSASYKERSVEWKKKNPLKVKDSYKRYMKKPAARKLAAVRWMKRRAFVSGAKGTFTTEQWECKVEYHGNKCIYCGSRGPLEIEHRTPLSRGGTNWVSNLAPACRTCNASKGSLTESEFRSKSKKRAAK